MSKAGVAVAPDDLAVIARMCDEGQVDQVLALAKQHKVKLHSFAMNGLLEKILERPLTGVEDAVRFLDTMTDLKARPDAVTYNIVMLAASRAGDEEVARDMLNRLQSSGFKVDNFTYIALIEAARDLGSIRDVICKTAAVPGAVAPDMITYSAAISQCSKFAEDRAKCRELALELAGRMDRAGIPREGRFFTSLMQVFAVTADTESAFATVAEMMARMRKKGKASAPNQFDMNFLLQAVIKSGGAEEQVRRVFDLITECGLSPNETTFTMLLKSKREDLNTKDKALEALRLVMAATGGTSTFAFNTILSGLVARRDKNCIDEVMGFLVEAREAGFTRSFDQVTFNEVIKALFDAARPEDAMTLFRSLRPRFKLEPDNYSYAMILDWYARTGDAEGAEAFWRDEMGPHIARAAKVSATKSDYCVCVSILMNAYLHAHPRPRVADVIATYEKYILGPKVTPNEHALTILLNAYCEAGEVDKALEVSDLRFELFNVRPIIDSYKILHSCALAVPPLADRAFEILDSIQSHPEFKMEITLLNLLLNVFAKAGQVDSAFWVLTLGEENGIAPNDVTISTLIHACAKARRVDDAFRVFEMHPNPDHIAFSSLMDACARTRRLGQAFRVLEMMEERGVKPDDVVMNALVNACCRADQIDKAWSVVDRMVALEVPVDAFTFGPFFSMFQRHNDLYAPSSSSTTS
jgi:leucine-rich PPR motif-containing protein